MFTTDTRIENFLSLLGVSWQYVDNMTFKDLEVDWDSDNIGRSQATITAAILEYGKLMGQGSAAPACILWENPKTGRYKVLDGRQRLSAEEQQKSAKFSVYVILTSDTAVVKQVQVLANPLLQGGYQESSEWNLGNAIKHLIIEGTFGVEELSNVSPWTVAAIRNKKSAMACGLLVQSVGGPEDLPDSILRVVAAFSSREDFAMAPEQIGTFLCDIKRGRFCTSEAEPHIEEFFSVARKGKLFRKFKDKLQEWRDKDGIATRLADPTRHKQQAMTSDGKLRKMLRAAHTVAKKYADGTETLVDVDEQLKLTDETLSSLRRIKRRGQHKRKKVG